MNICDNLDGIGKPEQIPNIIPVETPEPIQTSPESIQNNTNLPTPPVVAPDYQTLTDPKNQWKEMIDSLWNLIKLIFKIK